MKQEYFCEACRRAGSIEYKEHADFFSVLNALYGDHLRLSPQCPSLKADDRFAVINQIRVRNPELCSEEEWARIITSKDKPEDPRADS